ncbi:MULTISPECIES: hypothetical protein [unclassified Streptomyces]|uniref:hypothetical protein n=1 Tax=unclassified Streptomyces TaxID=2593676 RepID=UPI0006F75C06|nr:MULTISPECIES: hypothetical protein [unclassified Streptomyces]KQX59065.1 hypothetical protein ASD33_01820 [Streptomyces sp. Root1304]KRB00327.1 hypothetical protein ASE09_01820 [Streptomyces sp. Root66D1]
MASSFVPRQPEGPPTPPPGAPAALGPRRTPATSEATRLLCAGAYLDDAFRDAVVDELYVHEERFAAPSLGFDASRVLAHALRARRVELGWAAGILALWIIALPLTKGLIGLLIVPFLVLGLGRWIRGRSATAPVYRVVPAFVLRWYGRLMLVQSALLLLLLAFGDLERGGEFLGDGYGGGYGDDLGFGELLGLGVSVAAEEIWGIGRAEVWITLAVPLLVAWAVATQRGQFARALTEELSRDRFPDQHSDPAERAEGVRFRRLRDRIRVEQHARLVMYGADDPFCGAGEPYEPWSLSVELRPRADLGEDGPEPLDNSAVMRHVVPLVEALRVPSPHGSPQLREAVRDRLRELEIDEVVFLPVDGLPARTAAPYSPEGYERHRSGSIEEGGEARRHFLRIRVGGWDEEIVTTVFVRVHTQGGMLMLEVAPHVLRPVKPLYRYADRIAHRYRHNHTFGKAVWALGQTPRSAGQALVTIGRSLGHAWRLLTGGHARALPEGPGLSVRELGSDDEASLFQEMDVSRYLKSVQDRVTNGVTSALREAGYETAEFEQRIVHVAEGGTFIENTRGNVTLGNHNTVTSKTFTQATTGGNRG